MTSNYFVQSSVVRTTRGLHIRSWTLKIKHHVDTIEFIKIDCNLLEMTMTGNYSLQNSISKTTRRPHVKSQTLK